MGIMHQDLKPGNLPFDAKMNMKITDFGLSNECNKCDKLGIFCGSPIHAAPELFLGQNYATPLVDERSLGVVLYFMVTESLSFGGENFWELGSKPWKGNIISPFISP